MRMEPQWGAGIERTLIKDDDVVLLYRIGPLSDRNIGPYIDNRGGILSGLCVEDRG